MLSIGVVRGFHFPIAKQSLLPPQQLQQHPQKNPSPPVRFLSVSSTSQKLKQSTEKEQSTENEQSTEKEQSLNISYLVNSFGLSLDSAIYVRERVRSRKLGKTDAVLHLLKTHGFSLTQISDMIVKVPSLLQAHPEKNLLVKVNYLYSVGVSEADVVKIFSICPAIFCSSLEKHIIPTFGLLRDMFGCNKEAIARISCYPRLLILNLEKNFIPNIRTLRDKNVRESGISYMINYSPKTLAMPRVTFVNIVDKLLSFYGFNPSSSTFVIALRVMSSVPKSKWDKKIEIYQSWGWSEDMIHAAFRKYPFCFSISMEKLIAGMHFFVNEAGVEPSYIARAPILLAFSLEKRVIPRYTIYQKLLSRGLMKTGKYSMSRLLQFTDTEFKVKFVIPYMKEAPELLDIYLANVMTK